MCYNICMKRKRIGVLTACPEKEYPQRVLKGIFSQCEKYDYDVVVITPLTSVCIFDKANRAGELNIFEIINFNLFDGMIVTPIILSEDHSFELLDKLLKKFTEECKVPVVSIDMPFGDYPTVYTDDKKAFYNITEHLIKVHACKDISVLGGSEDVPLSKARVEGVRLCMEDNGLSLYKEQIYTGDFWYTSGEKLAERYYSGDLKLPQAVVCVSDFMAIGLTNNLLKHGIKVPQDVIVTGYDGVLEASINNPPITSYLPDQVYTGASAVNFLYKLITSDSKVEPIDDSDKNNLCIGCTCGCSEDVGYTRKYVADKQYSITHNYSDKDIWRKVDMTILMDSYLTETLTAVETPVECLGKIYESKYLIKPNKNFFICLNENWITEGNKMTDGYTSLMNLAVSVEEDSKEHGWNNHVFFGKGKERLFNRENMLPALEKRSKVPQVFYFVPIHFSKYSLGYAVVQNDLSSTQIIGEVFRNYIRIINNALEMTRAKSEVTYLSEHDAMTGLYNRRGMERILKSWLYNPKPEDKICAIVVDMDGLKNRNDSYGHAEGDKGIMTIAESINYITDFKEISVRGGGDEFYIFGIGKYTERLIKEKIAKFEYYLEAKNELLTIPVSASAGFFIGEAASPEGYQLVLEKADADMYKNKREKKLNRS